MNTIVLPVADTENAGLMSAADRNFLNILSSYGAVVYQGTWNATTNTPALASGVGTKGYYYKVSVAGTAAIDGNSQWNVGDTIIFDGSTWDKIDGISNEVVSVAGLYGVISASGLKSALAISSGDVSGVALQNDPRFIGLSGLSYVTNDRTSGGTPGAITLALADAGALLYQPGTDTSPRVVTIPLHASVAFADTETIPFFVGASGGGLVFTPYSGVTLIKADGTGSVATATAIAASNGTLIHITGDIWAISGGALS